MVLNSCLEKPPRICYKVGGKGRRKEKDNITQLFVEINSTSKLTKTIFVSSSSACTFVIASASLGFCHIHNKREIIITFNVTVN